jgi:hypothetical protein
MIDKVIDVFYSGAKMLVVIAGLNIIFTPPFFWVGTISAAVMVIAALVSIYAIWTFNPAVEFVALWFVWSGIGAYTGFVMTSYFTGGDASLTRVAVCGMALFLLAARGLHLWRLTKQVNNIERRFNNVD